MIKPWQKMALGMIAGTGLYSGVLYKLDNQTKSLNQQKALANQELAQKQTQQQQLQILVQTEQQQIEALQKNVKTLQDHTSSVIQHIQEVKAQIKQLQAGLATDKLTIVKLNQAKITTPKLSQTTTPTVIPQTPVSPPKVHTVTRASGG